MPQENELTPLSKWPEVVSWSLFGLVVLFFLILKSYSIHWQTGDENVYFYMAWATVDHGALPYADYFFAHPPLHLLPGMLVFAILGFGPITARLVPVCATLVGAVFLYLLAKRYLGRVGAVVTVFLYLMAFSLIRASTHWTGINLSVMWIIIGLWAFYRERPATSGICLAMGVCTGAYVLPAAMMLGLLALLRSRRDGLGFLMGFAIPWAAIQLICLIIGGNTYLDGVYRYHVAKPKAPGAARNMSVRVFTDNFALFLGTLLGPLLAWLDRRLKIAPAPEKETKDSPSGFMHLWLWLRRALLDDGTKGLARVGALWALGYVIFIAMLKRVFPFYFLLMFPAMAIAGGYAADRVIRGVVDLLRNAKSRDKQWWGALSIIGVILVAMMVGYLVRVPVQRSLLLRYVRTHDKPMKWSNAPVPGFVNGLLRSCCWSDVAKAYEAYGTVREILYHESRYFEKAGELAEYVKEHSREDQTIFGDSSTAGIVALLSGRRLQEDFADTNTMRFRSKITSIDETIEKIDTPKLAFVLVSAAYRRGKDGKTKVRYGSFASMPEFRRWLDDNFQEAFKVHDRTKGWFLLLERKPFGGQTPSYSILRGHGRTPCEIPLCGYQQRHAFSER